MPFPKGNQGRPKGTLNKQPRAIKDMILASLEEIGGKDYLVQQSIKNPVAYLSLLARVIPLQVDQTITRRVREMSDDELRDIASGSCARIAQQTNGESESPSVH